MLPIINKSKDSEYKVSDSKSYNSHKDSLQYQFRRENNQEPMARASAKYKVGGGFKLSNNHEDITKTQSVKGYDQINQSKTLNYANLMGKKSSTDINQQIRQIQKKIRLCQKKIQTDKKRKLEQQRRVTEDRNNQDFQQIIRKELELQGYRPNPVQNKNFDYLTNPGGNPQQQEPLEQEQDPQPEQNPYNIAAGIDKLQKFYENSLKKKFQRREMFPHKPCRRKTPKLYITQKTNALQKHGKPLNDQQHRFRVITKEVTPQEIYPVIPNFAVVKDNLSKNIVAYLGDYKPFLQKTKQRVQKQLKKQQGQIIIQNSSKIAPVAVNN